MFVGLNETYVIFLDNKITERAPDFVESRNLSDDFLDDVNG